MERKVALHRWATLAYVILLLCDSPALSMAFCVHHSRYLRSASYARSFRESAAARQTTATSTVARRKGMRRGRTTSMLHSDAYGGSTSTPSSEVQLSQLPTAMDRIIPFGRCVGVALPPALTDDVMTAAGAELLPKEMAYCLGLPRALQVLWLVGFQDC